MQSETCPYNGPFKKIHAIFLPKSIKIYEKLYIDPIQIIHMQEEHQTIESYYQESHLQPQLASNLW